MVTSEKRLNATTWTELTTLEDFLFQNSSKDLVLVNVTEIITTTLADNITTGIKIKPGEGLTSSLVTGKLWGKSTIDSGTQGLSRVTVVE